MTSECQDYKINFCYSAYSPLCALHQKHQTSQAFTAEKNDMSRPRVIESFANTTSKRRKCVLEEDVITVTIQPIDSHILLLMG